MGHASAELLHCLMISDRLATYPLIFSLQIFQCKRGYNACLLELRDRKVATVTKVGVATHWPASWLISPFSLSPPSPSLPLFSHRSLAW